MLLRVLFILAAVWLMAGAAAAPDLSGALKKPTGAEPPQTLQTIDLGKEIPGLKGRQLQMRILIVPPSLSIFPMSKERQRLVLSKSWALWTGEARA